MKLFRLDELVNIKNPDSEKSTYRPEILTKADNAESLGGMYGLLEANSQVPYHYHEKRESVLIILDGEAVEIVENKEYLLKAGDIVFVSANERHTICNKSNSDMRFIEFFTEPPLSKDFVAVDEKE